MEATEDQLRRFAAENKAEPAPAPPPPPATPKTYPPLEPPGR
jgi:hypothetical protein